MRLLRVLCVRRRDLKADAVCRPSAAGLDQGRHVLLLFGSVPNTCDTRRSVFQLDRS